MEKYNTNLADFKVGIFADTTILADCLHNFGFKVDNIRDTSVEASAVKNSIIHCDAVVYLKPYTSNLPFIIDRIGNECGITILYPFIYGWGVVLTVVKPGDINRIDRISKDFGNIKSNAADFAIKYGKHIKSPYRWLEQYVSVIGDEYNSAGECLGAAMCSNILSRLAKGKTVRYFPKFYIASVEAED